jgi:TolB-like protein
MVTHLTPARLTLFGLALCLLIPLPNVFAQARRAGRPSGGAAPPHTSVRIAVLPFRNALARQSAESGDASVLGDGIADSLTNALKSVSGVSVIDSEVVLRAASLSEGAEVTVKDADALRVAESLSAQIVVVGSFQLNRDNLHVDARLLTVSEVANTLARPMVADAAYPSGYSTLLAKLANIILTNLKLPLNRLGAAGGALAGTRSQEAYQWYVRGIRKTREGDEASLTEAIECFQKAIEIDPNYADALAAKSEAETRLYEIGESRGDNADALGRAAMDDAASALRSTPGSGRGLRARGRAQAAQGDYGAAARSAAEAANAWPGDVESALDRLRALGNGKLARTPETDRFLLDHPDLALLLPELPKVRAINNSDLPLTVRFIPEGGRPYPPVTIGAGGTRIVPLFAGAYRIVFESQIGNLERQEVLEAGRDYELAFSADSIPAGSFIFVNGGNSQLQVSVSGPLRTSLLLRPRETRSLRVPPGNYTVTGRVQSAVTSGRYELAAGDEETITYTYTVGRAAMFSPSSLSISNDGNAPLTVTISGPRRLTVSVPPGGKTIMLPAGTYTIRVACGRDVSEAEEYELSPDEETTLDGYSCMIRYSSR